MISHAYEKSQGYKYDIKVAFPPFHIFFPPFTPFLSLQEYAWGNTCLLWELRSGFFPLLLHLACLVHYIYTAKEMNLDLFECNIRSLKSKVRGKKKGILHFLTGNKVGTFSNDVALFVLFSSLSSIYFAFEFWYIYTSRSKISWTN